MTNKEAIEILQGRKSCVDVDEYCGNSGATCDMCDKAFDMAIEALEKQIPKKPRLVEDKYYECACFNNLAFKFESPGLPYCLSCGQKLDWGDAE